MENANGAPVGESFAPDFGPGGPEKAPFKGRFFSRIFGDFGASTKSHAVGQSKPPLS